MVFWHQLGTIAYFAFVQFSPIRELVLAIENHGPNLPGQVNSALGSRPPAPETIEPKCA